MVKKLRVKEPEGMLTYDTNLVLDSVPFDVLRDYKLPTSGEFIIIMLPNIFLATTDPGSETAFLKCVKANCEGIVDVNEQLKAMNDITAFSPIHPAFFWPRKAPVFHIDDKAIQHAFIS